MSGLLRRSSWRFFARHPGQAALTLLGVALGVAVAVAIDLANQSAIRAFALSQETLYGRATHQISGGAGGIEATVLARLRRAAPELEAAPVIDGWAVLESEGEGTGLQVPVQVLGLERNAESAFARAVRLELDPAQAARALASGVLPVVSSQAFAERLGLAAGSPLRLEADTAEGTHRVVAARLVGVIEPSDRWQRAALDGVVATTLTGAQALLGLPDRYSRIDLIVPEGSAGERLVSRLRTLLPPGVEIAPSARRTNVSRSMTRAFRLNLTALGLLALVCGLFLVYQTISFAVVQRRTELGICRTLGLTRRRLLALVQGEAAVFGVAGVALGLALGVALAGGLLGLVTQTLDDLYFTVRVRELMLSPAVLVRGAVVGIVGTLLAAARPAWEASRAAPIAATRRSLVEHRSRRAAPRLAVLGAALIAGGALALVWVPGVLGAFAALQVALIGAALCVPAATLALADLLAPVLGRGFGAMGRLAARGVAASLSRTGTATAALTVAVAVTLGVGAMITSFRGAVEEWLGAVLVSDVFVRPVGGSRLGERTVPAALPARLAALEGVARVNSVRRLQLDDAARTRLVVLDIDRAAFAGYRLHGAVAAEAAWRAFRSGDVLVSEPYARRHGVSDGDEIDLRTDRGRRRFAVAGVVTDYASDQGAVLIARQAFERFWADRALSGVSVVAAEPSLVPALTESVRVVIAELGETPRLRVESRRELREASLEVFDRTFTITRVLRLLLGAVAFAGVLGALMALQLERRWEWALLRAEGMTPRQLGVVVTAQSGLLGLFAGLLSLPIGAGLAAAMVYIVNPRSFGWTMDLRLEPRLLVEGVVLALVAALAAGVVPAWRMARSGVAGALREE